MQCLANFGVEATVVGQISGPRVTRYELQLAPGTKVVEGRAAEGRPLVRARDDGDPHPRADPRQAGRRRRGAEPLAEPRHARRHLRRPARRPRARSSVWLGKDISGAAVWTDLARMPHLLIAGTTGSGKSGCINTILTSILLRATPDEVRLILIDPKRIELNYYESIPHLLTPVVSSPKEASAVLAERRRRDGAPLRAPLAACARATCPRRTARSASAGRGPLPYLLVVIDELADLMMVSPQDVEDAIIRLAQKSRAVGIHLVLATQRPSVDVITGMIKANVPSRIAFAVSSQTDSRVILDSQRRREPARPGRHALQAARHLAPAARPGRVRDRGGGRARRRAERAPSASRRSTRRCLEAPQVFADDEDADDGEFDPDEDPLLDRAIEVVVQRRPRRSRCSSAACASATRAPAA